MALVPLGTPELSSQGLKAYDVRANLTGGNMRDLITGAVLIGIGFAFGGSVFLGDFSLLNIIFDGLGVFFIVRGLIQISKNRQSA